MCLNIRTIRNPYTHRLVNVKCGKCAACLQEKADKRSSRIRNTSSKDNIAVFVTLTYDNKFMPYFRKSDIEQGIFKVYRANQIRYVKPKGKSKYEKYVTIPKVYEIETTLADYSDLVDFENLQTLSELPVPTNIDDSDKVGMLYYKDVQLFIKRLRHVLFRKFNYSNNFKYFACSEYGASETKRPHFHLLLFIEPQALYLFKSAVASAWSFCSPYIMRRSFEIARDAASYVSSYVNCTSSLSPFFGQKLLKQKHSYSHGFGVGREDFRFPNVLKAIDRRDFTYVREINFQGEKSFVTLPIPKYVLHRYFPTFKGSCKLNDLQIYDIVQKPSRISKYAKYLELSLEQIHAIKVMLQNKIAYARKFKIDYAFYYSRCWSAYKSQLYKQMFDDIVQTDAHSMLQLYDNLNCFKDLSSVAPTLAPLVPHDKNFTLDCNLYDVNLNRSNYLNSLFYKRDKTKKYNTYVLSQVHPEFQIY